jgi:tRNA A37 threonylcarbamoyladenosine modification protein TsaB
VLAAPFSFMEGHYILPLIDAKKGEVFHALYRVSGASMHRLTGYGAIKPKDITDEIKTPCLIFGTGAGLCEEFLSGVEGVTVIKDAFAAVSAAGLIREALKHSGPLPPKEMQPIYGRRSEAEIKFNVTVT